MGSFLLRLPKVGSLSGTTNILHWSSCHRSRGLSSYSTRASIGSNPIFKVSEIVKQALAEGEPVVALETTIYTHGFPYPDNVALARDLESIVYSNGAIPATIGILDGVARVGLSRSELTALASSAGKPETMKVSRRDLPYILGMVSPLDDRLRSLFLHILHHFPNVDTLVNVKRMLIKYRVLQDER